MAVLCGQIDILVAQSRTTTALKPVYHEYAYAVWA